jgi:hypothetical protein
VASLSHFNEKVKETKDKLQAARMTTHTELQKAGPKAHPRTTSEHPKAKSSSSCPELRLLDAGQQQRNAGAGVIESAFPVLFPNHPGGKQGHGLQTICEAV